MPWRHAPHTADVALEVEAAGFEALCSEAAAALTALLVADPAAGGVVGSRAVRVVGCDDAERLHAWLAAVLLAFEVDGWVTARATVRRVGDALEGALEGAPFDPGAHGAGREVKAVTWHGLRVTSDAEGWRARVLLDL